MAKLRRSPSGRRTSAVLPNSDMRAVSETRRGFANYRRKAAPESEKLGYNSNNDAGEISEPVKRTEHMRIVVHLDRRELRPRRGVQWVPGCLNAGRRSQIPTAARRQSRRTWCRPHRAIVGDGAGIVAEIPLIAHDRMTDRRFRSAVEMHICTGV